GLLQHNSLAVRASDGLLLGLAYQQIVNRQPRRKGESKHQRQKRRRESALWQEGFQGLGKAPAGCLWVDVCDRGADAVDALHAALALGHHALIRACQDRCILVERDGRQEKGYLMQTARSLPGQCRGSVEVTQKGGRPARTARVQLAACEAVVEPPRHALK